MFSKEVDSVLQGAHVGTDRAESSAEPHMGMARDTNALGRISRELKRFVVQGTWTTPTSTVEQALASPVV